MQKLPANLLKRWLLVAGGLAIAGALAWAMWPKPVGVDFARATRAPLLVTVDEEGKTRIRDVYTVSAPIGGKLLRRPLEAGDRVKKDVTAVATIEPSAPPFLDVRSLRELEAQVEAGKAAVALAEAEIRQAESELEFAENELARARALIRNKTISERTHERARIDADTRRAAVARAKSNLEVHKRELESAQARLIGPDEAWKGEVPVGCCVTVRSPVSGRVLRLLQESERVVLAGTPLVDIGDPADIELVVEYLSTDAVKVREGAPAIVEGWGGTPLTAKVTRVEPAGFTKVSALGIEEQRVRIILSLTDPGEAAERLGHEFRVVVKIQIYESAKALRVPVSALFRKRGSWAVFTVERGRARLTPIEIGQRNTSHAEVLRGLAEGAIVLLHPSDRITEGVRVVRSNSEAVEGK
jgi:HlyD family secretion protein